MITDQVTSSSFQLKFFEFLFFYSTFHRSQIIVCVCIMWMPVTIASSFSCYPSAHRQIAGGLECLPTWLTACLLTCIFISLFIFFFIYVATVHIAMRSKVSFLSFYLPNEIILICLQSEAKKKRNTNIICKSWDKTKYDFN